MRRGEELSLPVFYTENLNLTLAKKHTIISAINDYENGRLTQEEVAAKYGKSRQTICAWIKKYYDPKLDAIVFGNKPVETDALVEEEKENKLPIRKVKEEVKEEPEEKKTGDAFTDAVSYIDQLGGMKLSTYVPEEKHELPIIKEKEN